MSAFYNEFDPYMVAWLRGLMREGYLREGMVDARSIKDVAPDDLRGHPRVHLFAGIAGWEYALELAGWPRDRPVWTGSCPCQPFSAAGKRMGQKDDRDLWPEMFRLVRECRPGVIFGEQVASADVVGPADARRAKAELTVWIDRVFADLEGASYSCEAFDLPAAGVGADHIRQRVFWVAHADGREPRHRGVQLGGEHGQQPEDGGTARGVFHPASDGRGERGSGPDGRGVASGCGDGGVADSIGHGLQGAGEPARADQGRQAEGHGGQRSAEQCGAGFRVAPGVALGDTGSDRLEGQHQGGAAQGPVVGADGGFWADSRLIFCRDGKWRRIPTQPGLFPLAPGVSGRVAVVRPGLQPQAPLAEEDTRWVNRVGALRGAGNAIVPPLAAAFIRAFMESEERD